MKGSSNKGPSWKNRPEGDEFGDGFSSLRYEMREAGKQADAEELKEARTVKQNLSAAMKEAEGERTKKMFERLRKKKAALSDDSSLGEVSPSASPKSPDDNKDRVR